MKENIKLVCVDCEQPFLFAIGEQKFYERKGLTPPKRCPRCRTIKRQTFQQKEEALEECQPDRQAKAAR